MLFTITTTHSPATDLGYLLHKHPGRAQSFDLSFGRAHVFYPEAEAQRCTAALLLEVDPIGLVRHRRGAVGRSGAARPVRERPAVCGLLVPERRDLRGLRQRAGRPQPGAGCAGRHSNSSGSEAHRPALPRRGGRAEAAVRALGLPAGGAALPAGRALPRLGPEPLLR
jgi:hypothetical protein